MSKRRAPRMPGGGSTPMMGQIQKLQEQLIQTREALAQEYVTASVGGGAVTITMSGAQHCQSVQLSPELVKEGDAEMIQDLLASAVNQAIELSQTLAAERLGPLTAGLDMLVL